MDPATAIIKKLDGEAKVAGIARSLERAGASTLDASHRALFVVYRQLQLQATTLAYLDAIRMLSISTALMIPLLFLTRKPRGAGAPALTAWGGSRAPWARSYIIRGTIVATGFRGSHASLPP